MPILTALKDLTDRRGSQGKRYELHHIVFCSILAVLSGANTYRGIHIFIGENITFLKEHVGVRWKRIPAYTTIRSVLLVVDKYELELVMRTHAMSYLKMLNELRLHIAIDGKTIRGSFDNMKDKKAAHLLNVFVTQHNILIAQRNVRDEKTNEIPVAQEIINGLNIPSTIYTMDAMHCQEKTLQAAIKTRADLIVQVKHNQSELLGICRERASIPKNYRTYTETNKGHGRIERREVTVYEGLPSYRSGWFQKFSQVIRVKKKRREFDTQEKEYVDTFETSYYLSSRRFKAKEALRIIKRHWHIENKQNNVLDNTFQEDKSRIRCKPEIMSLIRNISLNVLRMNGHKNISEVRLRNAYNVANLLSLKYLWTEN